MSENEIVKRNMGLVFVQAALFSPTTLSDFDDFVASGSIGLLQAVRNFDKTKGVAFSTYAIICIRREIIREIRVDDIGKQKSDFYQTMKKCGEKFFVHPNVEDWTEALPSTLADRDIEILKLRSQNFTLLEIGSKFGKTKQWAGNTLHKIIEKIQKAYE